MSDWIYVLEELSSKCDGVWIYLLPESMNYKLLNQSLKLKISYTFIWLEITN